MRCRGLVGGRAGTLPQGPPFLTDPTPPGVLEGEEGFSRGAHTWFGIEGLQP